MERITRRNEERTGYYYPYCFRSDTCGGTGSSEKCNHCDFSQKICDRLGFYEDLKEQGKIVTLPFTVGDIVYTNAAMRGWYFRKADRPYEAKVVFIGINGGDSFINVDFGKGYMLRFKFSEVGKTVFTTRKEAESALQGMEEPHEKEKEQPE